MPSSIIKKLWESSPGSISRAVKRRIDASKQEPAWFKIQGGPLTGAELFLPAEVGPWKEMIEGKFDDFIYHRLPNKNLQGTVFWDIGAHFGYHSLAFAALGAEVLAFEPNPYNAERLKGNLERNPNLRKNVRHLPVAVSDQVGQMTFVQSSDVSGQSSGSHLQAAQPPLDSKSYQHFEQITVETVTIDSLIERVEQAPDILKIDVEGAEHLVLQGGQKFLSANKPLLLMEIHNITLMFHVQKFLSKAGYEVTLTDEEHSSASRCFIIASKS